MFVDYGDNHICFDADGEPEKEFNVSSITQGEEAILMVHEDKRHSFEDGDYVKFREIEGMEELN